MPKLQNGNKGDSNPGSLYCKSGILPLSYRAPLETYLVYRLAHFSKVRKTITHTCTRTILIHLCTSNIRQSIHHSVFRYNATKGFLYLIGRIAIDYSVMFRIFSEVCVFNGFCICAAVLFVTSLVGSGLCKQ